jgi:hypothetical protein
VRSWRYATAVRCDLDWPRLRGRLRRARGVKSSARCPPSEVCATGTGFGAARALILWPELVTLGERPSRWPSWLWPLIIDGTIILATLGIVALAPYRDQLRNRGFFWVVLGIAALVSVAATPCTPGLPQISWRRGCGPVAKRGGKAVSHRVSHAISQQAVRRGGVRPWGAAEPAAVDRRITVTWLTSVLGEGFAPSTSLVTWKGRCSCRLGFQTLRTTW